MPTTAPVDSPYFRYLMAPIAVCVAAWIREAISLSPGIELPPFITYYPAVMLIAVVAGRGPGLLATVLAALLADFLILPPKGQFKVASASDVIALCFFMGMGLVMSLVAERYRVGQRQIATFAAEKVVQDSAKKLRQSEEQFEAMANAMPQLCWMANPDGWIFWYNQRWYDYTGTTREDSEGWRWQSVHEPAALPEVLERWKASIASGEPFEMVFPLLGVDGMFRPFLTRVMPVTDAEGKVTRWFGTNTDISEQKQIEAKLRKSKARLDLVVEVASIGEWELDLKHHTGSRSRRHAEIFGDKSFLHPEWSFEKFIGHVLPERRSEIRELVQSARSTGSWDFETQIVRDDGEVRWIWARGRCLMDEAHEPDRMFGTVVDITERRRAEEARAEDRARLDAALASMTDAVFISDVKGTLTNFNDAFATFHRFANKSDCPAAVSYYLDMIELSSPDGQLVPRDMRAVPRALRGESVTGAEFRLRRRDSGDTWFGSYSFSPIRDKAGAIVGSVVVGRDITESKRTEDALKQSEEILRLFVEHAPAALAMFDREMRYLRASQRWLADYGLTNRDLSSTCHYEVFPEIPERWREAHRRGISGEVVHGDNDHFERVDGTEQWVRWEIRPWYDRSGSVGGIVIFTEDVTERTRAERELKASLEEKTALLKEVHHRVKNNLQIVSSLLNLQARQVKNPAALEALHDTQGRIRSMALLHETLYTEGNAGRVNCAVYFPYLCAHLIRSFGEASERVALTTEIASIDMGIDSAVPCGLIVNELVTNSFKHAFPQGKGGRIVVTLRAEAQGGLVLSVVDDGVGIPPEHVYEKSSTLGMQLVRGLAKQIGAPVEVRSDSGTSVQIRLFAD